MITDSDLSSASASDGSSLADRRWRPWLMAAGASLLLLLLAQGLGASALRSLGLLPRVDAYTELYLSGVAPPPTAVGGTRITFGFTVHNVEHRGTTYRWEAVAVQAGVTTPLDHGVIEVPDNEHIEVQVGGVMPVVDHTVGNTPAPVLIRVDLLDQHQFVQFFVQPSATR